MTTRVPPRPKSGDREDRKEATSERLNHTPKANDLSLLGLSRRHPSPWALPGTDDWGSNETGPDQQKRMVQRLVANAAASLHFPSAPDAVCTLREEETGPGEEPDGDAAGKPLVAMGAGRLGVLLDYLVHANFYLGEEEFVACYAALDAAWCTNPLRVKKRFKMKPSDVAQSRIDDFARYRLDDYPIYRQWITGAEKVTNERYFRRAYRQGEMREYYFARARFIAKDTAEEFIVLFWDALEEEGYDLPVSTRWSLEDSIRMAQQHDDDQARWSEPAAGGGAAEG